MAEINSELEVLTIKKVLTTRIVCNYHNGGERTFIKKGGLKGKTSVNCFEKG